MLLLDALSEGTKDPMRIKEENINQLPKGPQQMSDARIQLVVYKPRQPRFIKQIEHLKMDTCVANNCDVNIRTRLTHSKLHADAVVYQGNRIPSWRPTRASKRQIFIFADTEPPAYVHFQTAVNVIESMPKFYDWTFTYKHDSDVWVPYGYILPRNTSKYIYLESLQMGKTTRQLNLTMETLEKNYTQIFASKSNHALWLSSHCETQSQRETYIRRMKLKMNVDIFGKCGGSRKFQINDTFDNSYKFYLAFENSFCEDYISEKLFNWFSKDIIVVVRGGADYSKFVPDGTYINSADFPSPEALADFLNKLGSDRERYIGYLKRKDQYQVISEQESVQNAFCTLCWKLNYQKDSSNAKHLSTWWMKSCANATDF